MDEPLLPYSVADIGTRFEHLEYLRTVWQNALDIMKRREHYLAEHEKVLCDRLTHSIALLDEHMHKDYREYVYGREINGLPPADSIEGGRGTPLRKPKGK